MLLEYDDEFMKEFMKVRTYVEDKLRYARNSEGTPWETRETPSDVLEDILNRFDSAAGKLLLKKNIKPTSTRFPRGVIRYNHYHSRAGIPKRTFKPYAAKTRT